jgi:hypothetical protein
MSLPQNIRASDRKDLANPSAGDFVVRTHFPSARHMVRLMLGAFIVVFGVVVLVRNDTLVGSLMCVLVGSIMLSLGRTIEKHRAIINATEFMNAIFSSVLCNGYRFCTIIGQDGSIIYFDRGFQDVFPEFVAQPKREIDVLLSLYMPDSAQAERFRQVAAGGASYTLTIPAGSNQVAQSFEVSSEPVPRPKGYVLLRGK